VPSTQIIELSEPVVVNNPTLDHAKRGNKAIL
jgi:hypothetical protein